MPGDTKTDREANLPTEEKVVVKPSAPVYEAPTPSESKAGTYNVVPLYDETKNLWEQGMNKVYLEGREKNPASLTDFFSGAQQSVPQGIQGFSLGQMYGQNVTNQIYNSPAAKAIWDRTQQQATQGLNAESMRSIKDKYGAQGVLEQARIQKAGLKGQAALRAGEDMQAQKRQEMAAMDYTIKKQGFDTLRDEWGRRTLLSTNLPMAYGQLGSAASLGQVLQNLAGAQLKY